MSYGIEYPLAQFCRQTVSRLLPLAALPAVFALPLVVHAANEDSGVDGSLDAANVSFGISSAAPTVPGTTHTIDSITVSGVNSLVDGIYEDLIIPDAVTSNFSVTSNGLVTRIDDGVIITDVNSDPEYDANVLPVFQDRNLNNFQLLGANDYTGDSYTLFYNTPVTSSAGGFVAITERFGNNPLQAESFDSNGSSIGSLDVVLGDYIDTGHVGDIAQNIHLAIFAIDDLAPVGSEIASIRITLEGNIDDGPDGKVFVFGDTDRILTGVDTDNDGVADAVDLDTDNDGIPNTVESPPVLGSITAGLATQTPRGAFTNSAGVESNFSAVSGTAGVNLGTSLSGIVEGLQILWSQGQDDLFDFDFTLQQPTGGILESIRVATAAPTSDSTLANAEKFITMTWPGGGSAILSDPLGEIDSHADGAVIQSGEPFFLNSNLQLLNSRWFLDIDVSGVMGPITLNYASDATTDTGIIGAEGIAFIPVILTDTDGDGIPNAQDLDSDNDGLTDALEAGAPDADADGIIDGFTDNNNDGLDDAIAMSPAADPDTDTDTIVDRLDTDSDGDSIADAIEAPSGFVDTDVDGQADHLDVDADADGIPDSVEAGSDPTNPTDTDTDGSADFLDQDSDNDGIPDALEAGDEPASPVNTDNDNAPDFQDLDADGDGIPDTVEAGDAPTTPADSDDDGMADFVDLDSDNDGIDDEVEAGLDPSNPVDADENGVADFLEPSVGVDAPTTTDPSVDPDTTPASADSDNDGIPDSIEIGSDTANPLDTDDDGVADFIDLDSDNDGLLDADEAGATAAEPIDTDGDGIADYRDRDSDSDGLTDVLEAGGSDADANGIVDGLVDANADGHDDNTAAAPLPDPDTDGDDIADRVDLDSDNDGLPDVFESAGSSVDADGDGVVDDLADIDGDGLADNLIANAIMDTDGDGSNNHQDLDSDNDGIDDLVEAGGDDLNGDGIVDAWTDTDEDGIVDAADFDVTGGEDVDGDGIDDFADADFVALNDEDDDGIVDLFDVDSQGTGFAPITAAGELIDTTDLPDSDGNGVSNILEPDDTAAQTEQGPIRTGLDAGGCSIGTKGGATDALVILLGMLAASGVLLRRRRASPHRLRRLTNT